jgi:hypothetical protein
MPQALKISNKITPAEFETLANELIGDVIAAVGLIQIRVQELLIDAEKQGWTIDQLLDRVELMDTAVSPATEAEQNQPDLIGGGNLLATFKAIRIDRLIGPGKKKLYLDRMSKKYGWRSGKYQDLITRVVEFNTEKIANKVNRMTIPEIQKPLKRLSTTFKRFTMPELTEYFPKESVFVRKAADSGKLLSDDLRGQLDKNLRKAIEESGITYSRGSMASQVNVQTINNFEKQISKTFEGYSKKDPKTGIPKNIRQIAVTEVRSVVDDMKQRFTKATIDKNNLEATKRWIHNARLSKSLENIRETHLEMQEKTFKNPIPFDSLFRLSDGSEMKHPHDPAGGAKNNIGCHCDWEIFVRKKDLSIIKSIIRIRKIIIKGIAGRAA